MKLSKFKKVVADMPAIYNDYEVKTPTCGDNYNVEDYTIDDANKQIIFEP